MAEEAKDEVAGTGVLESAEWVVAVSAEDCKRDVLLSASSQRSENTAINEDGIDKVAKRVGAHRSFGIQRQLMRLPRSYRSFRTRARLPVSRLFRLGLPIPFILQYRSSTRR